MRPTGMNQHPARHGTAAPRALAHRHKASAVPSAHAFTVPALTRAVPAARKRAARVLRDWGLHEDGLHTVSLVISELVGNAVRHACTHSPTAAVILTKTTTSLVLAVRDSHPSLPRLSTEADQDLECGRGLMIVDNLTRQAGGGLEASRLPGGDKEVRAIFAAVDSPGGDQLAACAATGCPVIHFSARPAPRVTGGRLHHP